MGVDAEELIVRPFREVVARGNEALSNADDADHDDSVEQAVRDGLMGSGRALVREGERALKRLQPVWDGQVEKYGDAFKDAMLQQDDVERRRRDVEDLLYDFEDYIELASYDASKFAELQAATRSFALDAINAVRRLKLPSPRTSLDKDKAAKKARTARSDKTTREKEGEKEEKEKEKEKEKSVFPPLPPLPSIPPMPPLPTGMAGDRRSRSSQMKQARMSAATFVTADGDESASVSASVSPSSGNLRRASTKSSVATSYSSASLRSSSAAAAAALADHADSHSERYQLYDHPEGYDASVLDDAPPPPTTTTIPRTSAWVRSHQQLDHQPLHKTGGASVRKKSSRDMSTNEYEAPPGSPGLRPASPSMQSRFNALNMDGSARSTYSSAYSSSSPVLTDGARTSFMSSAATSYTSSPVLNFATPPLPADLASHAEKINSLMNHPHHSKEGILPPPAMQAMPGRGQSISTQSIQDFIKFAPSPPVPPIGLPLSPKHRPQTAGGGREGGAMVATGLDYNQQQQEDGIDVEDVKEILRLQHQSRPSSRMGSSHRQLDWKPRARQVPQQTPGGPGPEHEAHEDLDRLECLGRHDHLERPFLPSSQQQHPMSVLDHDEAPDMQLPLQGHFYEEKKKKEKTDHRLVDETATIATVATTNASDIPMTREFVREPDCSIGAHSSFARMGGLCKGAELFRTGGHWQGIKQTGGYVANKQASIGRCVGCGYAHNYEEVRLDIERKPEATFSKAGGARFRLRLLYKSHLGSNASSARQAESHYACIFCVHAGATVREGDATVFTTPDHLLLHLARHPQPLPMVPGVTVVYGETTDASTRAPTSMSSVSASSDPVEANDFDLHLVNPPLPTPVPPSIGQAAVATAVREHMYRWGGKKLARPPGYTGDMLHFLAHARIVGVTFPEKWEGKWCMGWHDGFVGAFAAKAAQIEPPRHNEMPMAGSDSGMSVVARWRWRPYEDKSDNVSSSVWLSFDKGETISNVKCLYADHWCWAGTNSKGRFGVFPQSHILPRTLQQEQLAPQRAAKTSIWTAKSLFKGGSGHGSGRPRPPSSSAASSVSDSTGRTRFT